MKEYTCKECGKEFDSGVKLGGHMMNHVKTGSTILKEKRVIEYNKNPKLCHHCRKPLAYDKRKNKFCNHTCSASYNNKGIVRNGSKREKRFCLNCGKEIDFSKKRNNVYCNQECSLEYNKRNYINDWLETGKLKTKSRPPNTVREYLLNEQNNKCEICGMSKEWNEKLLVFICDHISGNSSDNSRENLRMICPNCDSQLDTYKAKNTGNGRFLRRKRYLEEKSF